MSARKPRFVVLVSGTGTNLQALIDAIGSGEVEAEIALVVSSDPSAPALERAAAAGIPATSLAPGKRAPEKRAPGERFSGAERRRAREAYDARLAELVAQARPDFVFLLGWMRILTNVFITKFPGMILNLHPALPGAFPGVGAIEKAWEASRNDEIEEAGVMIHFVDDERVDAGPVLISAAVPLEASDSLAEFARRMHETEHRLVREAAALVSGRVRNTFTAEGGA